MSKRFFLSTPESGFLSSIGAAAIFAVAGAVAWTLLGTLVALLSGELENFVREWLLIQGLFCSISAIFLGGLASSSLLRQTYARLIERGEESPEAFRPKDDRLRIVRTCVVVFVAVVGTLTTTNLGFTSRGAVELYLWVTCAIICTAAGLVTWHAIEILLAARQLRSADVKLFPISPATSQNLRGLAGYFTCFGVAMTVGYVFAFLGTVSNDWSGSPLFVRSVQIFWPIIYVPLSTVILLYPYSEIRALVRQEKDRVIRMHEAHIARILNEAEPPQNDDIKQINALADLIERIERSPDSPFSLPFATLTIASTVLNAVSLFIPRKVAGELLRGYFLG